MISKIIPLLMLLNQNPATNKNGQDFFQQLKQKTFIEQLQNIKTDVVYVENVAYRLRVNDATKEIQVEPKPEDEFTKNAIVFTYLIKRDMEEIYPKYFEVNKKIYKVLDDIIEESYKPIIWAYNNHNEIKIHDEMFQNLLTAYTYTPGEERLIQEVMQRGQDFWNSLQGDSWKDLLISTLGLSSSIKDLSYNEAMKKLRERQVLSSTEERLKATISYEIKRVFDIAVNEILPKNKEVDFIIDAIDEGLNTTDNSYLYKLILGFYDARFNSISKAKFILNSIEDLIPIEINNFSLENAKNIYFSPIKDRLIDLIIYDHLVNSEEFNSVNLRLTKYVIPEDGWAFEDKTIKVTIDGKFRPFNFWSEFVGIKNAWIYFFLFEPPGFGEVFLGKEVSLYPTRLSAEFWVSKFYSFFKDQSISLQNKANEMYKNLKDKYNFMLSQEELNKEIESWKIK